MKRTSSPVLPCAGPTETGWCAEFSITEPPVRRLRVQAVRSQVLPQGCYLPAQDPKIGCALYYPNRDDQANLANISWAAGTTKGVANDDGTPSVSWTARDNGVNLVLKWHEGMTFAENAGIRILQSDETEGTRSDETEPVTEPRSTAVVTTVAPESRSEPESTAAPLPEPRQSLPLLPAIRADAPLLSAQVPLRFC